ncbi:RAB23 family protein [Megaselia abdita]
MLWDTAGQEEFDAITKAYYRGAQACVLAFSTTDKNSFDALWDWKRKVENECGIIPMVIVQNKIDLISCAVVTQDEVKSTALKLGCHLIRTSVKEDINVVQVFRYLASQCFDVMNLKANNTLLDSNKQYNQIQRKRDKRIALHSPAYSCSLKQNMKVKKCVI